MAGKRRKGYRSKALHCAKKLVSCLCFDPPCCSGYDIVCLPVNPSEWQLEEAKEDTKDDLPPAFSGVQFTGSEVREANDHHLNFLVESDECNASLATSTTRIKQELSMKCQAYGVQEGYETSVHRVQNNAQPPVVDSSVEVAIVPTLPRRDLETTFHDQPYHLTALNGMNPIWIMYSCESMPSTTTVLSAIFSCDKMLVGAWLCDGTFELFNSDALSLLYRMPPFSYIPSSPRVLVLINAGKSIHVWVGGQTAHFHFLHMESLNVVGLADANDEPLAIQNKKENEGRGELVFSGAEVNKLVGECAGLTILSDSSISVHVNSITQDVKHSHCMLEELCCEDQGLYEPFKKEYLQIRKENEKLMGQWRDEQKKVETLERQLQVLREENGNLYEKSMMANENHEAIKVEQPLEGKELHDNSEAYCLYGENEDNEDPFLRERNDHHLNFLVESDGKNASLATPTTRINKELSMKCYAYGVQEGHETSVHRLLNNEQPPVDAEFAIVSTLPGRDLETAFHLHQYHFTTLNGMDPIWINEPPCISMFSRVVRLPMPIGREIQEVECCSLLDEKSEYESFGVDNSSNESWFSADNSSNKSWFYGDDCNGEKQLDQVECHSLLDKNSEYESFGVENSSNESWFSVDNSSNESWFSRNDCNEEEQQLDQVENSTALVDEDNHYELRIQNSSQCSMLEYPKEASFSAIELVRNLEKATGTGETVDAEKCSNTRLQNEKEEKPLHSNKENMTPITSSEGDADPCTIYLKGYVTSPTLILCSENGLQMENKVKAQFLSDSNCDLESMGMTASETVIRQPLTEKNEQLSFGSLKRKNSSRAENCKCANLMSVPTGRSRGSNCGNAFNGLEIEEITRATNSGKEVEEQELSVSDKEENTAFIPRSSNSILKQTSFSMLNSNLRENIFPSDKENRSPSVLPSPKARKLGRVPFQSINMNSKSQSRSCLIGNATSKATDSINYTQNKADEHREDVDAKGDGYWKKWNMVVDTSCLLDEESIKSLMLLEGFRGTHLIIPQMVIRELQRQKRKISELGKDVNASSALRWIKECMLGESTWIHVQNTAEMVPIPPACSSHSYSNGESQCAPKGTMPFSKYGDFTKIVDPTAGDHILECAILLKKLKKDEEIVLLTNDTSLTMKALSKGLICETAKDFRLSLVNPLSRRFLWADSRSRGPNWGGSNEARDRKYRTTRKAKNICNCLNLFWALFLFLLKKHKKMISWFSCCYVR